MPPEPLQILRQLDLAATEIVTVDPISERHGHRVWRVVTAQRSYILKWLPDGDARREIEGYALLQRLGVPTVPLYGETSQALLLEDLAASDTWRLAVQDDLTDPAVGRAVARWYRDLHRVGEALLAAGDLPDFLARESDALDADSVLATGQALGLSHHSVWELAADHIQLLKRAEEKLTTTLNYNDFYWTNLALSRAGGNQLEAIVFDYHLLGLGMPFSDCRNVTGALSHEAACAFWETYGAVDPRQEVLDRPLAILYNLHVASRMSEFPRWAEKSRKQVLNGKLERTLIEAIALTDSLPGQTIR